MKKILSAIIALALLCSFASCSAPLELKVPELTTYRGDTTSLAFILGVDQSELQGNTKISAVSKDESIIKVNDQTLVAGNTLGETTVEITMNNRKGTLKVKVVPYMDYLYEEANKADASGFDQARYYASQWLVSNLDAFKNPTSVSVNKIRYPVDAISATSCDCDYFIMEIRAQNGFGGYGVEYYKVAPYRIEKVTLSYDRFYGTQDTLQMHSETVINRALKEHIESRY